MEFLQIFKVWEFCEKIVYKQEFCEDNSLLNLLSRKNEANTKLSEILRKSIWQGHLASLLLKNENDDD